MGLGFEKISTSGNWPFFLSELGTELDSGIRIEIVSTVGTTTTSKSFSFSGITGISSSETSIDDAGTNFKTKTGNTGFGFIRVSKLF